MSEQILIVDDDNAVCVTVEYILQRAGSVVTTTSTAAVALVLARDQRFDLIICDLVMPDMDGVTLIRIFKDKYPRLPIIAMSGGARLGTFDTLPSAREAGADELLRKPFSAASLIAAVSKARASKN